MITEDGAMTKTLKNRIERLKEDYDRQPCGKKHAISLDELSTESSRFSKEVTLGDCVIDFANSKLCVVQGGVIPIVVDFAGVYIARMHSDNLGNHGITPLFGLKEVYFKPFVMGVDKRIVARAMISEVTDFRIFVIVFVENEKGDTKGQAKLSFALKFRKA